MPRQLPCLWVRSFAPCITAKWLADSEETQILRSYLPGGGELYFTEKCKMKDKNRLHKRDKRKGDGGILKARKWGCYMWLVPPLAHPRWPMSRRTSGVTFKDAKWKSSLSLSLSFRGQNLSKRSLFLQPSVPPSSVTDAQLWATLMWRPMMQRFAELGGRVLIQKLCAHHLSSPLTCSLKFKPLSTMQCYFYPRLGTFLMVLLIPGREAEMQQLKKYDNRQ